MILNPDHPEIIEYLGNNKKSVCVLVNCSDERWIRFKEKLILGNILKALDLELEEIALVNINHLKQEVLSKFPDKLPGNKIISFGVYYPNFELNKVIKIKNKDVLVVQDNLTEIGMSREKKGLLWKNLKEMFGKK